MKLWIEDYDSSNRKDWSLKAAQGEFETASSLGDALVVALHESNVIDQVPYSSRNQYKEKLILVYSGGERPTEHDKDVRSKRVLYLMWPVSRNSYITEFDWTRISKIIVERENEYYWSQHEIFPVTIHYLSALTILCQGYLAAHFPEPSKASGPVKEALERMGWTELAETDEGKAFVEKVATKVGLTNNPGWWQNVFDMPNDKLVEKVEEEWDAEELPNEISELLHAFHDNNLSNKGDLVAQVYLKLEEKFKERIL